jgi:hypothetical protein
MKLQNIDLISISNQFSQEVLTSILDIINKNGYGIMIDSLQSGPRVKMFGELDLAIKKGISNLFTTLDYLTTERR